MKDIMKPAYLVLQKAQKLYTYIPMLDYVHKFESNYFNCKLTLAPERTFGPAQNHFQCYSKPQRYTRCVAGCIL
ncbi:hypothetical protein AX774_g274 [Zancudomyces culisetae]|uniref:Uncharacterized protein n=1 Tax=Zancudomyces culisetae TaxID=1213189 RepID=A0A1R1PYX8_ZANCU|nr:hypothetical protein AX774_g274 [Zancudomyces culisetae]|eukprot:OMH86160.1 hypothetical protein AX774_g274 [Zancudomyces culisetae]